ncbi:MAG: methylmalonyl Co-A mutase-associated GTPase MeaB [Deltaproteobacteria bacterium]|nr:MAG: methylmalonyl Co-A mutase-associated GTPase MeaB [Deltaproteobacteria bacterium]
MPPELARRLLARDRAAVPEALNLVDDARPAQREAALELLDFLETQAPFPGPARIGLTGPPGAGKSTLLDALVRALRQRGRSVAIVAVDPSSQRSGGALLGDRARVRSARADPGVFIRSMAARSRLGGLADATHASVTILAAVFDCVFIETVGVGQSEAEVARVADSVAYVAQPGAGDVLQYMKAGVLELPDVFVVNKSDRPDASQTAAELATGLSLSEPGAGGWTPPVLLASARAGTGIDAVEAELERHYRHILESGELDARRRRAREAFVIEALTRRYGSFGLDRVGGPDAVAERLREAGQSSFALVGELSRRIERALAAPAAPR